MVLLNRRTGMEETHTVNTLTDRLPDNDQQYLVSKNKHWCNFCSRHYKLWKLNQTCFRLLQHTVKVCSSILEKRTQKTTIIGHENLKHIFAEQNWHIWWLCFLELYDKPFSFIHYWHPIKPKVTNETMGYRIGKNTNIQITTTKDTRKR
jgi:hypothetical protein